jgi:maltooligosyltrehalose trehalohydrolase
MVNPRDESTRLSRKLGAVLAPEGCTFTVWAPLASKVMLHIVSPAGKTIPMEDAGDGYFTKTLRDVTAGHRYFYHVAGKDLPDPASCYQPEGVHGASEVCDRYYGWTDQAWRGIAARDLIIYELHVGTYTSEGTFQGVIARLPELKSLGVTAIELMPVSQFPGTRNWGYDGVNLFTVQNSYGGPAGLKQLVDAAHEIGLAVILDVVYNHFGPEGNYLPLFGPYFTDRFKTPWGPALNFDGAHSDHVRRFFIENAIYWQTEFHLDGLRLDAVHAIIDNSAVPFLRELKHATAREANRLQRPLTVIAESDLNAPRIIQADLAGGYGLDAQWSDDFHHCLHVLLTGERDGYYTDYTGGVSQFAKVWRSGYAYTGEYSAFRARRHGDFPAQCSLKQFVVCAQNHDQVGNRRMGERLSVLSDIDSLKLAAAAVLLSPFTPLLFMGEEYGEQAPFQYFVDHSDADLIKAVQAGRQEEFAAFYNAGKCPDPASEETFQRSSLKHSLASKGQHRRLREFYEYLISLRKTYRCIGQAEREHVDVEVFEEQMVLLVRYKVSAWPEMLLLLCFARSPVELSLKTEPGPWDVILNSAANDPFERRRQTAKILNAPARSALLLIRSGS